MWKTLSEKIVHKNKWYKIIKNTIEFPNKKKGEYFTVDTGGGVIIIPIKDGKIIFEKVFRYPIKKYCLELPMGGINIHKKPLKAASEELEEETGYKAKKIRKIGSFIPFTGVSNEICYAFIATDLKLTKVNREISEEIELIEIEIEKAYKMAFEGKIKDGMTLAALSIARKYLLKNKF
jgi:ADP-ribose pyrophosphatase